MTGICGWFLAFLFFLGAECICRCLVSLWFVLGAFAAFVCAVMGMGTEEIGILILYQHPQSAHKESLAPIFVASEQGLDTSVYKRVFKPPRLKSQICFIYLQEFVCSAASKIRILRTFFAQPMK